MKLKTLKALKALKVVTVASAVALLAGACGTGSPAQPSGVTGSSSTSTSFAGARAVAPLDKAQIAYASQPVTLAINNGVAAGSAAATYTFEVATDSGFTNKLFTKAGVAAATGGVTQQSIAVLPGGATYYWHAQVNAGGASGPYSSAVSFTVGPQVTLQVPVLASPAQNATASGIGLTLTVNNVVRSGPAGVITYRFDVSDSSSFGNIVFSGSTAEQAGGSTSIAVTTQLTSGRTYYWRVLATDVSGATSGYSAVFSFQAQNFNLSQAIMVSAPPDFAQWPQTATITSVNFTPDAFEVDFDRRDGPNRWIDQNFGDQGGTIQYTLGLCGNIGGQWYCSMAVLFWYGRDLDASTPPSYVGQNWFYDPVRWGPMAGYQPADGELVGLFVGAGPLRNAVFTLPNCPEVCERSNVALVPWSNEGGTSYTFSPSSTTSSTLSKASSALRRIFSR